jgi:predicted transposase YbfD/YdcC
MGTQTKIADQVIEQEGSYALALKDNQGTLYEEVKATFVLAEKEQCANVQYESNQTGGKDHGRLEIGK